MMKHQDPFDGMPEEVKWAIGTMICMPMMGANLYNKIKDIIERYPQYFPWEHKYSSIPEDVHKAYREELEVTLSLYLDREKPIYSPPKDNGDFYEYMQACIDFIHQCGIRNIDERIAANKIEKEIWDKHYSKFGLEFREPWH